MRGHLTALVKQVQSFVADTVQYVRQKLNNPNQKVVLIIDSIERIRGVGKDESAVYESIRNLFVNHADKLELPLLHMVYTVPPYLSVLVPGAGSLMGGAPLHALVSTHVFKARSRDADTAGLKKMQRIIAARYADWTRIFTEQAVNDLALTSGGDLREFFRLLRPCLTAVREAAQLPLSLDAVTHAKNSVRNAMLPIAQDQLVWLAKITKSYTTCLPSVAELPTMAHFLDTHLVLNYRNGEDWYDVHPLIRDVVDQGV